MGNIVSARKLLLLLSFIIISLFLFPSFKSKASTEPNWGTVNKLTDGSLVNFPSVSGNILTYLDILDKDQMIGHVVIKNLDTDQTITNSMACFQPSVNGDIVVFSCMEGLFMVDTSTLDWDNPESPTVLLTEVESLQSRVPQVWDHYVLVDNMLVGGEGIGVAYLLYDLDEPYSEGVNPIALGSGVYENIPAWGVLEDGVVAWYDGTSIKIYNLNDTTPEIQSFDVATDVVSLSVNQDYIAWSINSEGEISGIGYKSLSDLEADPVEIYEQEVFGPSIGPKLNGDHLIYMVTYVANKTADIIYYDISSGQRYLAQQNIDFDVYSWYEYGFVYLLLFPPYSITDTTLYWGDLPDVHHSDIYSLSYASNTVEESVEPPVFSNLPSASTTINITEGQSITTNPYTIRVKPTSDIGISKVEFYIDNILICTVTSPDDDGVYSCDWDTSKYHSEVKVIAYDTDSEQVILNRSTTVNLPIGLSNPVGTTSAYQVVQTVEDIDLEESEEAVEVIPPEETDEEKDMVKEKTLETVKEEGKESFNIFDYWVYILVGLVVIPVIIVLVKGKEDT